MTKLLSVDQSLAKCAWFIWEDGKVINNGVIKTGSSSCKKKFPQVKYFDRVEEQIIYISTKLVDIACHHNVDKVVFEALSLGSMGNATRDLACLYGAAVARLCTSTTTKLLVRDITSIAPTALKSFAREFINEADRYDGKTAAGKPKLIKMDKKLMVKSAINAGVGQWADGWKMSGEHAGLDDVCDAYLLGRYYWDKLHDS